MLRETVVQMFNSARAVSTVELFVVASAFLAWLHRQPRGSSNATCLKESRMKQHTVSQLNFDVMCRLREIQKTPITDVTWWALLVGTLPGSAFGAQTAEALHQECETPVRSMAPPGNINAATARMRQIVLRWVSEGCLQRPGEVHIGRLSTYRPRPLAQLHKLGLSSPEEEYVCQTS